MDIKIPNIRHLRAFYEVSHCKSISKASKRVHLSQPAITQAIAKLERLLELSLFDRSNDGMFTTEPGLLFLQRVESALEHIKTGVTEAIHLSSIKKTNVQYDRLVSTVQLRALIAVAEEQNFSLAARSLGTSQPAIYRAARELEQVLGIPLFLVNKEGIELTKSAVIFAKSAKLAFAELKQGFMEIESWNGRDSGVITIGTMPLAKANLLPKAITKFTQSYPDVQIHIVDGPYSDLLHGLRHGDIDFLIGALRYPLPIDDISQEALFEDTLTIAVRAGHPLIKNQHLSLDDLTAYPWVIPREGTPTRDCFNSMFESEDTIKPAQLVESSSLLLIRNLLLESDLIALLSRHQVQLEEKLGLLATLHFDMPETRRKIGLTIRIGWRPTSTQFEFLKIMREIGKL